MSSVSAIIADGGHWRARRHGKRVMQNVQAPLVLIHSPTDVDDMMLHGHYNADVHYASITKIHRGNIAYTTIKYWQVPEGHDGLDPLSEPLWPRYETLRAPWLSDPPPDTRSYIMKFRRRLDLPGDATTKTYTDLMEYLSRSVVQEAPRRPTPEGERMDEDFFAYAMRRRLDEVTTATEDLSEDELDWDEENEGEQ